MNHDIYQCGVDGLIVQKAIDVLKTKPESQLPFDVEKKIDSIVEEAQQTIVHR